MVSSLCLSSVVTFGVLALISAPHGVSAMWGNKTPPPVVPETGASASVETLPPSPTIENSFDNSSEMAIPTDNNPQGMMGVVLAGSSALIAPMLSHFGKINPKVSVALHIVALAGGLHFINTGMVDDPKKTQYMVGAAAVSALGAFYALVTGTPEVKKAFYKRPIVIATVFAVILLGGGGAISWWKWNGIKRLFGYGKTDEELKAENEKKENEKKEKEAKDKEGTTIGKDVKQGKVTDKTLPSPAVKLDGSKKEEGDTPAKTSS